MFQKICVTPAKLLLSRKSYILWWVKLTMADSSWYSRHNCKLPHMGLNAAVSRWSVIFGSHFVWGKIMAATREGRGKRQWGLFIKMATDWEVSEVGDTCRPAAGPGRGRSVQIEWISAGTAHLGFPALWSVPHLLSREIKMNRRHCSRKMRFARHGLSS